MSETSKGKGADARRPRKLPFSASRLGIIGDNSPPAHDNFECRQPPHPTVERRERCRPDPSPSCQQQSPDEEGMRRGQRRPVGVASGGPCVDAGRAIAARVAIMACRR